MEEFRHKHCSAQLKSITEHNNKAQKSTTGKDGKR
jgi:hypothetical protein